MSASFSSNVRVENNDVSCGNWSLHDGHRPSKSAQPPRTGGRDLE